MKCSYHTQILTYTHTNTQKPEDTGSLLEVMDMLILP